VIGLKLPFQFDCARLQRDLALVAADEWSPHYNERDFGGAWTGVALRSARGSQLDLHAGHAGLVQFFDTPVLQRCPYFQEVLRHFPCPLKSVRLLSLAPGSFIREHSDHALGFEDGEIRIHVPIRTNPMVEFYVCGERLALEEGGCYYVNVNLPHRVNNRGTKPRVHMVIDAAVDDWVRELFARCMEKGAEIPRSSQPPGSFDEFAQMVFADDALREKLRAIPDRRELLRLVVQEAAARGFDLNEADAEAACRAKPSAGAASVPEMKGWVPVSVRLRDSEPWATWAYAPGHRFTEPFFEESVRVLLRDPFTKLFRRELPLRPQEGVAPDGFIFHLSRCGSTLISRSLAAAHSTLVLSEPPLLDAMVQSGRVEWLQWMVAALGQSRSMEQTRFLIKLDAWHIRSMDLFRAAFPDVPWIFVVRDPLEVMASHARQPGLHTAPGAMNPEALGMRAEDITGLTRHQWCARVLEGFLSEALRHRDDPQGIFVEYGELPGAICGKIAGHFGLALTPEDEDRVRAATVPHAKNPQATFDDDHERKRKQMESFALDSGLERLRSLYRELLQTSAA